MLPFLKTPRRSNLWLSKIPLIVSGYHDTSTLTDSHGAATRQAHSLVLQLGKRTEFERIGRATVIEGRDELAATSITKFDGTYWAKGGASLRG